MVSAPDYAQLTKQVLDNDHAALAEPEPSPDPRTAQQKAESLRELGTAAYLYAAAASVVGDTYDVPAWKCYLDSFLEEAGNPSDPVERMLLEQLALAHHSLGRLHVWAGSRQSVAEAALVYAAIARLVGELRRTALTLKAYRQSTADKAVNREPLGTPPEPEGPDSTAHNAARSELTSMGKQNPQGNGHVTESVPAA
jgi:hypothetical protein